MQSESSKKADNKEKLSLQLRLLAEADAGHLDSIKCPNCRQAAVSVWFTHPVVNTYRTWFICARCHFVSRAQNSKRPPFFSEARVCQDLEDRDLSALNKSIFKVRPSK
jgi:phage FluMu protein Com